jgi:hypothetical protein
MAEHDNNGEVIEGTAVEVSHPAAVIPPVPPSLAVIPTVQASELVQRLDVIRDASEKAMTEGVDYGKIPGTDKPTLLKPGAEKLGVLFQLDVQLTNEKVWGPGDHLTVISRATVFHAPTGARLGFGEGLCTTREKKYGKRKAERSCPSCGAANIRKSKRGDGFYCWEKTGGCGQNFRADDKRITEQTVGDVDNLELPDCWNTVVKMAEKRARVDAVLAVTGASALFTQDIEDAPRSEPETAQEPSRPPSQAQRPAPQATAQAEHSERPATAKQKGAINARCGQAQISDREQKAIVQWVGGTHTLDRVSSKLASKLIDQLGEDGSGAQRILTEIAGSADEGNPRAKTITERYLQEASNA